MLNEMSIVQLYEKLASSNLAPERAVPTCLLTASKNFNSILDLFAFVHTGHEAPRILEITVALYL